MTPEEVIDFFAPHETTVTTVIDWVVGSGIARERVSQSVNKQVGHLFESDIFAAMAHSGVSIVDTVRCIRRRSWRSAYH